MNKTIRNITSAAVLTALSVISTLIFKQLMIADLRYLRFSLTPSLVIFSSLALGPFYGAVVGVAGDLIPAVFSPQGAPNLLVTLVYAILGVLPWVFEKITRKFRSSLKPPFVVFIAMGVILAALAAILFLTDYVGGTVFQNGNALAIKFIIFGIMFAVGVACCVSVTLTNRSFERKILEYSDMPSPNETALISLLCEFLVLDALKSLAFLPFYGLRYEEYFMMIFLGLPVNVTISTICVYWMLVFDHKHLHLRSENNKKDE